MSLKSRLEMLERRRGGVGCCPSCGHQRNAAPTIIKVLEHGRGEPTGYFYQMAGRHYPYPPDPRPRCPTCGRHIGPIFFVTAFYDGEAPPDLEVFVNGEES